ncbi:MAG TPA: hypothetical protein VFZ28_10130 [Burkholderiaceae bacterium]|nr:hypothetical protein [Burkholderiaceae bacterium]
MSQCRASTPRHGAAPAALRALRAGLLALCGLAAGAASQAQDAAATQRDSFRVCDEQAFLVLNIARNYMTTDRNRDAVIPYLKSDAAATKMAEGVMDRIDAGTVRHPGQEAADALFQCAAEHRMKVGAPRQQVALCFTRTDIAFFLHVERSKHVVRENAVHNVSTRLTSRELYPASLIEQVAKAVYAPAELPDLRRLMGTVAWACIRERPVAASAAGG